MTKTSASCKAINKGQLRFHQVKMLKFTAGYARKEAQVHTDMHLVFSELYRREIFILGVPGFSKTT